MAKVDRGFEKFYQERVQAAKEGRVRAFYDLGLYYFSGQGVGQCNIEAYKFFHLAASHGLKRAEVDCREMEDQMSTSEISKALKLTKEWNQSLA